MRLLIGFTSIVLGTFVILGSEWNQFRGSTGQGHAKKELPLKWSRQSPNLKWRTPIDGNAWSSPILVNDLVVVTNSRASSGNKSLILEVIALAGNTGEEMWKETLFSYPDMPRIHRKNSYASPTPFFDGESIFPFSKFFKIFFLFLYSVLPVNISGLQNLLKFSNIKL